MSLEAKLEALTSKIEALTTVTESLLSLRTDAIETVRSAAAPAATAAKGKAKAEEPKKEEPAAPVPADEPAADPYAEAKALIAKYTTGSERPEEVAARKEKVRAMLRSPKAVRDDLEDPTKFAVTDVRVDAIPLLIKTLKVYIDKGDITQPADPDADLI